ncbi:GNAT family N-acetyltransferase [Loktanella sp. S4079]|uniref:GNAT family N-acetyltransferase n=1 Tax=Loktanella sp. S4079 TaxID=579483 RepID=UPI00061F7F44|nr:GNAT family N-acetyltransferase [Loktanella sp. S4079]KJZ20221.1 hypothetical protein TW80_05155 [Loktanella sp. S4079]
MPVPTLQTDRLVLRALHEGDLEEVTLHAGDFAVSKWLVPVAHPYTYADAQEFLAMDRAGEIGQLWVITLDTAFQGVISVGKELGYWLAQHAWGQGIATEAAQAALSNFFETQTLDTVHSSYFLGNERSARVLYKLGFREVGPSVQFSKARGQEVDARSVALSRQDWLRANG